MATSFDLLQTPLPVGKMLIEASAGTGKTYSLTGIIARLVMEENIPVERILVVTYTESATAELKDRVRNRMVNLLAVFDGSADADDDFESGLLANYSTVGGLEVQTSRLRDAVCALDRVSISTIHGFCSRMLTENAFESGSMFETEVITNSDALIQEVAGEYWRRQLYRDDPATWRIFTTLWPKSIARLQSLLREAVNADTAPAISVPVLPESVVADFKDLAAQFKAAVELERDILDAVFTDKRQLNGNKFRTARKVANLQLFENVRAAADPLDALLDFADPLDGFKFITHEHVSAASVSSTTLSLNLQTFKIGSELQHYRETLLQILEQDFIHRGIIALESLKAERNVMTFHDILVRMRNALINSESFVDILRYHYTVALVDEFQDTDAVQLEIFRRIFDHDGQRLYCVGDPKQSIYKFRGADLDTYLQARNDNFVSCVLDTNFRSDEAVVEAVNQLFSSPPKPFGEAIEFHPVAVPESKRSCKPPLKPAFIFQELADTALPLVARSVAHLIPDILLGLKHLQDFQGYRSVAVLVNSHNHAEAIANACHACGIPTIRRIDDSVFASSAATLLWIALAGIIDCGRVAKLKAALLTPLFGWSASAVRALDDDDRLLDEAMENLHGLRQLWLDEGFIAAFQRIMIAGNVRARLLRKPNGEESLSRYLHLAELLQQHEELNHASPDDQLRWLRQMARDEQAGSSDASAIRRSTDTDAVVISTIHSSKGLEYHAVIVPFAWAKPKETDAAENMRKFYVAVTRAKHHCTVLIAAKAGNESTALAQLLGSSDSDDLFERAIELADQSAGFIGCCAANAHAAVEQAPLYQLAVEDLQPLPAPQSIPRYQGMTSFSALTHGSHQPSRIAEPESAAADHTDADDAAVVNNSSTSSDRFVDPLPLGAKTGLALHAVFEHIDFQSTADPRPLVVQQFARDGMDKSLYIDHVCSLLPMWLSTPLMADGSLSLNQIPAGRRLDELEFHFPLRRFSRQQFVEVFTDEPFRGLSNAIEQRGIAALDGYMKGYIDLVFQHAGKFYILDWKSNHLGDSPMAYSSTAINASMLDNLYHLQYFFYTIALDAYLRRRIPGYDYATHFGGVFYVYLRGFGGTPGHSVFHTRPLPVTVSRLKHCLMQGFQS